VPGGSIADLHASNGTLGVVNALLFAGRVLVELVLEPLDVAEALHVDAVLGAHVALETLVFFHVDGPASK